MEGMEEEITVKANSRKPTSTATVDNILKTYLLTTLETIYIYASPYK
jgi:hypothetical protein